MKKILFFAIALIAGVLAFTSCNKNGNDPVDPKDVTAQDLIGVWRQDSAATKYMTEWHRSLSTFTDKYIIAEGDSVEYTYDKGVISGLRPEWNDDEITMVPFQMEIVSFDRSIKSMTLVERNAKDWTEEGAEVVVDKYYYFVTLPEITGKDMPITEENVKGDWMEEYTDFQQDPYPMERGVNPHYMFYRFGDNHTYLNLMMVDPVGGFPHPGFWKYENGKVAFRETYSGQTYDDIDWVHINWYKVDKLTDKYMVLHCTWDGGEEIFYLRRATLPDVED